MYTIAPGASRVSRPDPSENLTSAPRQCIVTLQSDETSADRHARRRRTPESQPTVMRLRETLRRWLHTPRPMVSKCPACQTPLSSDRAFCSHCYMVLRPEGMAELHEALQGTKVREDIYILRRLHRGGEEDVTSSAPPRPPRGTEPPVPVSGDSARAPAPAAQPRTERTTPQGLMAYTFSTLPPAGPGDLPALIRWFLDHDPLIPNNLEILEEAHRILCGAEDGLTYERHLGRTIADDLRIYDSRELLEQHLTLLTTVYARTLQTLRARASQLPRFRSPVDLPEPERRKMWASCFTLGLTATRLRVEGWIYRLKHGELPTVEKVAPKRRVSARARGAHRGPR